MDLAAKFQGLRDHPKCLLGAADSRYGNSPISEDSTEYALIHADSFDLLQQQFEGMATDEPYLYQDALIGDGKFGTACLDPRRQKEDEANDAYCKAGNPAAAAQSH